ncbi:ImmA/IrrE family metallo-endopeptidase [uncultured Lactobacillus sp.]|uniref:ImmA/IrrE family metallo-endopeptidase n=1 Tax=uncultured Lactobacillus sp. TaxID=153152 RepID=UPI00260E94BB|nr:ImmA/IrrE family metallo-endopeptidase [uncultured Lactobacillus sp.]
MINNSKNDLITYLLNYAMKHGFSYTLVKADPRNPSVSFKDSKRMFINTNWINKDEIPFTIAHEIGHLMLGDQGIMYFSSFAGQNSEEKPADDFGLKLIYDYSCKMGDGFTEPIDFIQNYGIPHRMLNSAIKLFKECPE